MADPVTHADKTHAAEDHIGHHVPLWLLAAVLGALLVLTFITVGVTQWDFGSSINLWVAMIIATVKGTLVALYFMHLRYDKPIIAIILFSTLVFVALFIGLTLMDSLQYQSGIAEYRADDPERYAPELVQPE
jgi:cytochrome c oxidase subunit 4